MLYIRGNVFGLHSSLAANFRQRYLKLGKLAVEMVRTWLEYSIVSNFENNRLFRFLPILNAASWNLAYGVLRGSEFFRCFTFFILWKQLPVSRQIRKRGELLADLLFLNRHYESVNRSILVKLYQKIAFTILLTSRYINFDFLIFQAK